MQNTHTGTTGGSQLVGELTPGRLGENTSTPVTGMHNLSVNQAEASGQAYSSGQTALNPGASAAGAYPSSTAGGVTSGVANQTGTHPHHHHHAGHTHPGATTAAAAGLGAGAGAAGGHHHHHSHSPASGLNGNAHGLGQGNTAPTGVAAGAAGTNSSSPDFGRRSAFGDTQTGDGHHVVPGMEHIGTGYSGTAAASGDIHAPTGTLPPGTVEKGATNQPIPRPSPKDFFKMSNAGAPASPAALANRPVHQDPISEADHLAPTHGGHSGQPANMTSSFPSQRAEPVDPYAARAHGDHLARGVKAGTGYAGTAAASGDISAPTGSLPAGTTELGATGRAIPRPSPKDLFKMHNSSAPSNPTALANRPVVQDPLTPGTDASNQ